MVRKSGGRSHRPFIGTAQQDTGQVILVQPLSRFDWLAWARADPVLAAEIAVYRPYATVDGVLILSRTGAEK